MKRRFQLPGRLKWRHSVKWQLLTVAALSPFTFISFYRFGFCCGLDSQKIVLLFPLFQDPSRVQLVSDFSAALPVCAANQTMAQRSNVLIKVETTQLKGTRSRCTQTRPSTLLGQGEMIVFDNCPSFSDKNKQKRHFPFIRLWFEWIISETTILARWLHWIIPFPIPSAYSGRDWGKLLQRYLQSRSFDWHLTDLASYSKRR